MAKSLQLRQLRKSSKNKTSKKGGGKSCGSPYKHRNKVTKKCRCRKVCKK